MLEPLQLFIAGMEISVRYPKLELSVCNWTVSCSPVALWVYLILLASEPWYGSLKCECKQTIQQTIKRK